MTKFNKVFGLVTLTGLILSLMACKDSQVAQFNALGSRHKITLYGATGTVIGKWESTGNVSNEANSDGWYFKDAATDKLVEVTGTLVIEQE
jgi:hypothetical protein